LETLLASVTGSPEQFLAHVLLEDVPDDYIIEPGDDDLETLLASVTGSPEQFLAHVLLEDLTAALMNRKEKPSAPSSEVR
uniref:Magnesium transporter n=1 Tax=Schistocephalus solidus TaxID=70667 RepID=A0A183T3N2_SCHSO